MHHGISSLFGSFAKILSFFHLIISWNLLCWIRMTSEMTRKWCTLFILNSKCILKKYFFIWHWTKFLKFNKPDIANVRIGQQGFLCIWQSCQNLYKRIQYLSYKKLTKVTKHWYFILTLDNFLLTLDNILYLHQRIFSTYIRQYFLITSNNILYLH